MAEWPLHSNHPQAQLEYRPIDTVFPCPEAPRKPNRQARRSHEKLVRNTGINEPVIVDENGVILSGELQYATYCELGYEMIPVICINWLSSAQKVAYRIAAGRIPELANWKKDKLKIQLDLIVEAEVDLELEMTGFSVGEIDLIIQHDEFETACDNNLPDPPLEPVTRPGDIWVLGHHRLFCGSCLETSAWSRLMCGERARLCLTDPPYNVPIKNHVSSKPHAEFAMASGEMSREAYEKFLATSLSCAIDCTVDGGLHLIAMDHSHMSELLTVTDAFYDKRLNIITWAKTNAGMGSLYRSAHEFFVFCKVGTASHVNNIQLGKYGRNRSNVWTYAGANQFRKDRDKDLADHPTVKPVDLVADAILDLTEPNDIVIDGFGGSGTLILAAEQTGRRARVIEIEPRYCDVAVRRWEEMTGKKAIHRPAQHAPLLLPAPNKEAGQ